MVFKVFSQNIINIDSLPNELNLLIESTGKAENRLEELKKHLSADEADRANRFIFDVHKTRFIIRRGRLREELSKELKCTPIEIKYCFNEFNKPYLSKSGLKFNFSHSDDLFALLLSDKRKELGVDIETTNKKENLLELTDNYFSETEREYVHSVNVLEQKIERFLTIWTRKEAFLKLIGTGLINDLKSISLIEDKSEVVIHEIKESLFKDVDIRTIIHKNFIVSLAWHM